MRYAPKIAVKQLTFCDFSGGMNTSLPATLIADNELSDARNVEYINSSRLSDVQCMESLYANLPTDMAGVYRTEMFGGKTLFWRANGTVMELYDAEQPSVALGQLDSSQPCFCPYLDVLLIASGGKLQKYTGAKLEAVKAKHNINGKDEELSCDLVWQYNNRVVVTFGNGVQSDYVLWSAVRSYEDFTFDKSKPDGGFYERIGMGDGAVITALASIASDLIVFKRGVDNGVRKIYRVTGDFGSVQAPEVARDRAAYNQQCVCVAQNNVYFLDEVGFCSLQTVIAYGSVKTAQEGYKIAKALFDDTGAFSSINFVPWKNQIMITGTSRVWLFSLYNGAWSYWKIEGYYKHALWFNNKTRVADIAVSSAASRMYVTNGQDIIGVSSSPQKQSSSVTTKMLKTNWQMLIKKLHWGVRNSGDNFSGYLRIGDIKIPFQGFGSRAVYGNHDPVYGNHSGIVTQSYSLYKKRLLKTTPTIQVQIVMDSGPFAIEDFVVFAGELSRYNW